MKIQNYLKILLLCFISINYSCSSNDNNPELSSENRILSFSLTKDSYIKQFSVSENSVEGNVDSDIELAGISLDITISENASITPDPSTITSITEPFTLTVIAENGNERNYDISIDRELSNDNSIIEFRIDAGNFSTLATVNDENGIVFQKVPENIDLTNLDVSIIISDRASSNPEIDSLIDFSSSVSLIITSESGLQKTYDINITHMNESFSQTCDEMNAWKWFGGDNRIDAPNTQPFDRNVGSGQAIILDQDLFPTSFSVHLRDGFRFDEDDSPYNESVELKLNIRNENGVILMATTTDVSASFNGGFIPFDLTNQNLFFENDTVYIFQWYLLNGALLGVTAGSSGNNDETAAGFCFNGGYSGQSKISDNSALEELDTWYEHPWNFNIKLEGKQ